MGLRNQYARLCQWAEAFEARQEDAALEEVAQAKSKGWFEPRANRPNRLSARNQRIIAVLCAALGMVLIVAGVVWLAQATSFPVGALLIMILGGFMTLTGVSQGIRSSQAIRAVLRSDVDK